jgi:hypothetical protein
MPATLCSRRGSAPPPSGSLCTRGGERDLWSRSNRWRAVERVHAAAETIRPPDQAEAAFDVLDPLDDEPDDPDDPDEPEELDDPDEEDEDDDPELSEDDALDEPEEDSDLPGFKVLVVDVLRESVR